MTPTLRAVADLLTVPDVAERLHCSEETVRRRIRDGQLPARRAGRRLLVHPDAVETYLDASPAVATITRRRRRRAA